MQNRPAGLPLTAVWDEAEKEWKSVSFIDELNRTQGPVAYWRSDGSLMNICHFIDGKPHGVSLRYHENGEISQICRFDRGSIEGERVYLRSTAATTENFPPGLGKGVHKIVFQYRKNSTTGQKTFNLQGEEVMPNGKPFPKRPASVPAEATLAGEHWVQGLLKDNVAATTPPKKEGTWKKWTLEGTLIEESNYVDGKLEGVSKQFDENGTLIELTTFKADHPDGKSLQVFSEGFFVFAGEHTATGNKKGNARQGHWEVRNQAGELVSSVDFGEPSAPEDLILWDSAWDPAQSVEGVDQSEKRNIRSAAFLANKDFNNALLSLVIQSPMVGVYNPLRAFLKAHTWPTSSSASEGLASEVGEAVRMFQPAMNGNFRVGFSHYCAYALSTLFMGANPSEVFKALAVSLDSNGEALLARSFIDCALALEPEQLQTHFSAGLIRMNCGDATGIIEPIRALDRQFPEQARALENYAKVLFRPFDFKANPFSSGKIPDGIQPFGYKISPSVTEINEKLAASYAWIQLIREKVRQKLMGSGSANVEAWLPPDLSAWVTEPVLAEQREHFVRISGLGVADLLKEARKTWEFAKTIGEICGLTEPGFVTDQGAKAATASFDARAAKASCTDLFVWGHMNHVQTQLPEVQFAGEFLNKWEPWILDSWVMNELSGIRGAYIFISGDSQFPVHKALGDLCSIELDETQNTEETDEESDFDDGDGEDVPQAA